MDRVIIVSGGTVSNEMRQWLYPSEGESVYFIACDKGMEFFYKNDVIPNLILGDMDSVGAEAVSFFENQAEDGKLKIKKFPSHKDATDTELGLDEALRLRPDEIIIIGAIGSRLDHVMGNLQLLIKSKKAGVPCYIVDEFCKIRLLAGEEEITISNKEQYGEYVSIIPFGGNVDGLTLDGFEYPVRDISLEMGNSLGISNRIVASVGSISIEGGMCLVIEARD